MRNSIAILGISLFPIFFLFSCSSPNKKTQANQSATEVSTHKVDTVVLQLMKFNPEELNVSIGDTVIWINKGMVTHTVKSYQGNKFYSDTIKVGASWKWVVKDSATYFCSIHPTMQGKLAIK